MGLFRDLYSACSSPLSILHFSVCPWSVWFQAQFSVICVNWEKSVTLTALTIGCPDPSLPPPPPHPSWLLVPPPIQAVRPECHPQPALGFGPGWCWQLLLATVWPHVTASLVLTVRSRAPGPVFLHRGLATSPSHDGPLHVGSVGREMAAP